ncbi:helix-turn-helix domain-containing protein [Pelagibius sp.]|uniref:AraC-like ligand-binding domain-containing protein n=1 Tax=Pelagibius sp. TaxID=1931238 RepID=UPI003BB190B6
MLHGAPGRPAGSTLLAGFPQVRARDLAAAHGHVTQHFGQHQISKSTRSADLRFAHRHARLGDVSFNTLTYGADVDAQVDWTGRPYFLMMVPLAGQAEIFQGGRRSEVSLGDFVIIDPREQFDLHLDAGQSNLTVAIPTETLKRALAARGDGGLGIGSPGRLAFSHGAQAIDGAGAVLMRFTDFLCGELEQMQTGGMAAQLAGALEASFLHLFLQATLEPGAEPQRVVPRSVRIAQRHMRAHLKEPIATEAVAQAAGVSQRTLRAHFAEACGTSPGRWLLDQRLAEARRDLERGDTSVTEVALRYAFGNVGRFSQAYRQVFGEYPSQTLPDRH